MGRNVRIFVIVTLVALVLTLAGFAWYLNTGVIRDPTALQQLAQELRPLQVPSGLQPEFGTDLFGFRSVFLSGSDPHDRLALAVYPSDADERSKVRWDIDGQHDLKQEEGWTPVAKGTAPVVVDGEEHEVSWMTAKNSAGALYRSMLLHLPGPESSEVIYRRGPADKVTVESFQALFSR